MLRFLAFVFHQGRASAPSTALITRHIATSHWQRQYASSALHVLTRNAQAHHVHALAKKSGTIIGSLFRASTDDLEEHACADIRALSELESEAMCSSAGEYAITRFWGSYVAFLDRPHALDVHVLRSPSAQLGCYAHHFPDFCLFFSHVADAHALGLRTTPNSRYLFERMLTGASGRTEPLQGIQTLQRGERVTIDFRRDARRERCAHSTLLWRPQTFARAGEIIEDANQAAAAMRATVLRCARTWIRQHDAALVRLSGGLDSSTVLAALTHENDHGHVLAYTYYDPRLISDERPWARLAAQRAGVPHIEKAIDAGAFSFTHMTLPLTVEPICAVEHLHHAYTEAPLAMERSVTAIFNGEGGDSGYGKHVSPFALLHFLQRQGLKPRAISLAVDVALYTQQTVWQVLARSIQRWLFGSTMTHQMPELHSGRQLLCDDLLEQAQSATSYPHPWFEHCKDVPWALIKRLGTLPYAAPILVDPLSQPHAPELIALLQSQPAVELFLRIPIDVLFEGGRDRGLARRAFADLVPDRILQRTWKDRAPGYDTQLVDNNRVFIRDALLTGLLVKQRILDPRKTERALAAELSKNPVRAGEILMHLDLELWMRRWSPEIELRQPETAA